MRIRPGGRATYSYSPPEFNISQHYIYLNSLFSNHSPQDFFDAGKEAENYLTNGLSNTSGLFESSKYKTALEILRSASDNERSREVAMLNIMAKKVQFTDGELEAAASNPEKFYNIMLVKLNEVFDKGKKFRDSITHVRKGKEEKAERKTQRLYDYLEKQLYNALTGPDFTAKIKEVSIPFILESFNQQGQINGQEIKVAIQSAALHIINSPEILAALNKFTSANADRAKILGDQLLDVFLKPSGLGKIDELGKKSGMGMGTYITSQRTRTKGQKKTFTHDDSEGLVQSVRGLGMETYTIITQNMVKAINGVLSMGASAHKTDILATIGEINIDNANMLKKLYNQRNLMDEEGKRMEGNMLNFATEIQNEYDKIEQELTDMKNKSFIIHTSAKDYLTENMGNGFDAGGGMSLEVFAGFLEKIGAADVDFLVFALNNLSAESINSRSKDILSTFLAQYIGAFAFDDGITIYSKAIQDKMQKLNIVHLFMLNGKYIPLSFLLSRLYQEMMKEYDSMQSGAEMKKLVSVTIKPMTGYYKYLRNLKDVGEQRWVTTSRYSMKNTQIKMRFLQDFNNIISNLNI